MSVKIMGAVWDCELPQNEKLVLLAYADHASHDGSNVYPSVGLVAWKTGYTERSVQLITKKLKKRGILVYVGSSKYDTNQYIIDVEKLPKRPPYRGGENFTPPTAGGGEIHDKGGEISAPGGVKPISPEPSLINHQIEPPNAFALYEQNIGMMTPLIADAINDAVDTYPANWIEDAIAISVTNNKRSWGYVEAILDRWQREGRDENSGKRNGKQKPTHDPVKASYSRVT